ATQVGGDQIIVCAFRKALATPIVLVVVAPVHLVAPPVDDGHFYTVETFTTDDFESVVPTIPVRGKYVRDFQRAWCHRYHYSRRRQVAVFIGYFIRVCIGASEAQLAIVGNCPIWINSHCAICWLTNDTNRGRGYPTTSLYVISQDRTGCTPSRLYFNRVVVSFQPEFHRYGDYAWHFIAMFIFHFERNFYRYACWCIRTGCNDDVASAIDGDLEAIGCIRECNGWASVCTRCDNFSHRDRHRCFWAGNPLSRNGCWGLYRGLNDYRDHGRRAVIWVQYFADCI